jgi:hypothetical protein
MSLLALLMSFTGPMSRNRSVLSEISHTGINCARFDATFERWIPRGNSSSWSAVKAPKRDYGDLTMKAQLILIASVLLLISNVAGAQETNAPSAGAQEQQAPWVTACSSA